jgi:hypothetical protein
VTLLASSHPARVCHENIKSIEDVKKCSCKRLAKARYEYFTYDKEGGRPNGHKGAPNG